MNSIQKISIALTIIIASQLSFIIARPTPGGNAGGTRAGGARAGGQGTHTTAAGGAAVHNNNQQQSQKQTAAVAGAASMANQNAQNSVAPMAAEQPAAAATSADPAYAPQNAPMQQNAMPVNSSDVPAIVNNVSNPQQTPSELPAQPANNAEKAPESEKAELIAEDKKTIAPDQTKILEQLETINVQDNKTNNLLSTASMNQLFNNFVYFKDFIVNNFKKDKIMSLCTEFVNQIYPKDNVAVINVATPKSANSNNSETQNSDQASEKDDEPTAPADQPAAVPMTATPDIIPAAPVTAATPAATPAAETTPVTAEASEDESDDNESSEAESTAS